MYERKIAEDTKDELDVWAEDRQDAVLERLPRAKMKKEVRRGSVQGRPGSVKGSAWRRARPCSRLRLTELAEFAESDEVWR